MIVEQSVSQVLHHSGPLPRATELARYKEVDDSFPERIVRMAEKEQENRHRAADETTQKDYKLKSRGQHYALALAALILAFAAYLGRLGDTNMAGKVAMATLVGIVGIFVSGKAAEIVADRKADSSKGDDGD